MWMATVTHSGDDAMRVRGIGMKWITWNWMCGVEWVGRDGIGKNETKWKAPQLMRLTKVAHSATLSSTD